MLKRLIVLLFTSALIVTLGTVPAEALHPRGDVYEKGRYNDPYEFVDEECGFPFEVKGRSKGHFLILNVPGSDGQAFLANDWYRFREVLTNPANGKKMYISGRGYFREVAARQVEGDIWEFDALDSGTPFVVRDGKGRLVLKDHGTLFVRARFDTLGDSQPGAEFVEEVFHKTLRGSFPSWEPDFDFCAMVDELIG